MTQHTCDDIRTLALVGQSGAGKTSLAEALLHAAGAIPEKGSIDRGSTVCDYDPLEKNLKHSLETAICNFEHRGRFITLLDTPGYPDFLGRSMSALPAVETAAVVINAGAGIESMTQKMMKVAAERHLCRLVIINRMDTPGVDLRAVLRSVRDTFGKECLPMNLPAKGCQSVVDCFFEPSGADTEFASVADAHTAIVDQVVEVDEALMEVYLEKGEVSTKELHDPFEQALREGHLIPVCFTSAETGAGIAELLETIARLMPSPREGNPPEFLLGESGEDTGRVEVAADPEKHVIAHVFKVNIDPFMGQLGIFRIHQGTIRQGTQLYVGDARKPFKVAHLFRLQGSERIEVPQGCPGDICAVAKIEEIHYDAVLHDSQDDIIHLRPLTLPEPMVGLAISPMKRGDEQKLSEALHKLDAEDPGMRIEHNISTNETVLRGQGEFHLRVLLEKMKVRYNVEVETHPPRIAYRESITASAEGHYRHKKQTGGAGQFGEVFLRVEPMPRGSGFEFENAVVGGSIPTPLIPAVEKGVRQVLDDGAVAGYPLHDVKVTVYDGKHHPVDSKEVAFVMAGKKAFMDAVHKARPIILEPIVHLEVTAPSSAVGDISGDLSGRRGRIQGNTALTRDRIRIDAEVPLGELDDYPSRVKSLTGGEGTYSLSFSSYEPVPKQKQQELAAAYQPHDDGD